MKQDIRTAVEAAIKESTDFKKFIDGCKSRGVQPSVHISGTRVCGFSFRMGSMRVKGSELGRNYTWDALRQRLDYEEQTDFPVLEELLRHERNDLQGASLPDDISAQHRRRYGRQLLDDAYAQALRDRFGDTLAKLHKEATLIELLFVDGNVLRDFGTRISVDDSDPARAASRIVATALVKGWPAIVFNGNPEFVKAGMREALAAGLPISTKDTAQEKLLAEVRAEGNMAAGAALAPQVSAVIRTRIDALRDRYKAPAEPDPTQPQRHFKL